MGDSVRKFARVHLFFELIILAYIGLYTLNNRNESQLVGFIIFICALLVDFVLYITPLMKKHNVLVGVRYAEILVFSAFLAFFNHECATTLVTLFLTSQMFELIFIFDYTDIYSRTITIGAASFPLAIFIIADQLFFSTTSQDSAVEMICIVAAIMIFVAYTSGIFADWIIAFEKRVFEQRRMTENAKEMNETLRIHQEKIKKANEELGIQKIKMEAANRQVSRVNSETVVQNEILKYIASTIEVEPLTQKITDSICNSMKLKFCAVLLYEWPANDEEIIYHASSRSMSDDFMRALSKEIIEGGFDELIRKNEIVVDKKLHRKCFEKLNEDELSTVIIVPIVKGDRAVGAILCGHERQDYFDESTNMFENLSTQILMALDNANLYAEVQQLAIRDGLTGLYNRRHLNALVEQYSKNATEDNLSISAALMDIDHFKGFNDTYGHIFGDLVLKRLSELAEKCANENGGIASRYGGEEFVLVFLGIDLQTTNDIMIKLMSDINNMVLEYMDKKVSVRVSIGVTAYPEICATPEEVLNRADLAMYYSKEHGRNQITIDSEEVHEFFKSRTKAYQETENS